MKRANKKSESNDNKTLMKTSLPRQLDTFGQVLSFKRAIGPIVQIDLASVPFQFPNTSWASGVLAVSTDIINMTAAVNTWSSRWGACFREYRVVGARITARLSGSANPAGEIWMWLDEKSSTTPTSADAQGARRAVLPIFALAAGSPGSEAKLSWMPHDLIDLDFTQSNAAASDIYLKTYAAPGVTGTTTTTTATITITASYRVQFRGVI